MFEEKTNTNYGREFIFSCFNTTHLAKDKKIRPSRHICFFHEIINHTSRVSIWHGSLVDSFELLSKLNIGECFCGHTWREIMRELPIRLKDKQHNESSGRVYVRVCVFVCLSVCVCVCVVRVHLFLHKSASGREREKDSKRDKGVI